MTTDSNEPLNPPGTPPDPEQIGPAFRQLCEVVARLRSPTGCPWDREQTLATIKPFTLEETYELLEAIDSNDDAAIVEELGDVLLQVILDSQIGADEGRFDLTDVVAGLTHKMITRHPHVFGDQTAATATEVTKHWDRIKQQEKQRQSIFDGLPLALPALARAARISSKAARVGYDFPSRDMLFDKLREELDELAAELYPQGQPPAVSATASAPVEPDAPPFDPQRQRRIEGELGDVLFVLANIARRWHVNPEEALRASNQKFERRVQYIERRLKEQNRSLSDATLAELELLYQEGKQTETSS
ncbi:MAG: nucleoside triphosphate pyrophosphohydrolase [Planctomycetes bacterium]|nr:nucleoside triphosphate pyrophosphohydrolase [Planctomycetota bacterium]